MNSNLRYIFLVLLTLNGFWLKNDLSAQNRESLLKAGFIEKFTHFIQWPEGVDENQISNQFKIKIIGDNPFGETLEELFKSITIQNKNVEIEYISRVDEIETCNILFISDTEKENLSQILEYTSGKPILTISDTKGFGEKGVLINLFNEGNYIRYEVNKNAIEDSRLDINSLLLSYAVIIESNG